jgi:hypothetical protein
MAMLALSTAVHSAPYGGGNANPMLINKCQDITGLTVSLYVTQDIVPNTNTPGGGFSMQLNADPPKGVGVVWLQYIFLFKTDQPTAWVEYWPNTSTHVDNMTGMNVNLPSNIVPAGSKLTIALASNASQQVSSSTFSFTDNTGHTTPVNMTDPSYLNMPEVIPLSSFWMSVVGPWDGLFTNFTSGAGYLTYSATSGPLAPQGTVCSNVDELVGTDENSNSVYGAYSPGAGTTLVQPMSSPNSGALTSNMDTAGNKLQVYHLAQNPQTMNMDINQFAWSGAWASTDVSTLPTSVTGNPIPPAVIGSPLLTYENTIYDAPETFYLAANTQGVMQIEQLWGENSNPANLTGSAQPPTPGSSLAGFIDPILGTDNVFYQGTDQHIHQLSWSPGVPWAEDTRVTSANAPTAAFASQLNGHMTPASEELFYVGSNQHVYELWRWSKNYDGWHLTDVTMANGVKPLAAVGSQLAGFWDSSAATDVVLYMSVDQHLHELLFAGSIWRDIDVAGTSGAPAIAVGSAIAAHFNTSAGSEEVYVVNQDQTIEEMWSWPSQTPTWHAQDAFTGNAANAQPANIGTPLVTDMDSVNGTLSDEVYYVGTDGNVHEVWNSANSGGWHPGTP